MQSGAIRRQRRVGSVKLGAIRKESAGRDAEGQVSSAKQFATGARSAATSEEQSSAGAEAESAEPGSNRKERSVRKDKNRSGTGRETPSTEQSGHGAEGQVSSAEQSANGAKR